MPRAPKKCAREDCEVRAVGRYCPTHAVRWASGPKPRTSTSSHQTLRGEVLKRDGYRCQIAGPRCTVLATEADHIVAVAFGGADNDPANLQAACSPCHADKTKRESAHGRWGTPL